MTATLTAEQPLTTGEMEIREASLVSINAAADWYAEGRRAGIEQGCVTEREMVALRIIQDELARFDVTR